MAGTGLGGSIAGTDSVSNTVWEVALFIDSWLLGDREGPAGE